MTLRSHGHRSTHVAALAVATALAAACHKDTQVTSRVVTAWVPTACPVDANGYGTYLALGDYDGNQQPTVHHPIVAGTNLTEIDTQARELVIGAQENDSNWEGLAPVPSSGDVNVLVLPHLSPCALSGLVGARPGSTIAPIGTGVMITGGNASPVPPTYVADLTTGAVTKAQPDVTPPRLGATVTPFGDGALVSGGISDSSGVSLADAQFYSPSLGGFDRTRTIALSEPRANHAAVVLADGRTVLVGGSADAGGKTLLKALDVIDPTTMSAQEEGFATLVTPRLDPIVVRLASGEILVAGGKDTTGQPVTTMEWISYQAGTNEAQQLQNWVDAPFTMTALEGGGALVVENSMHTWIIGAVGDIKQATGATLGTLPNPVLFGGAGGAPVLWTGNDATTSGRFLRWLPWMSSWGEFVTIDGATPSIQGTIVSPDPGLGIWFDASRQQLVALRFDTRNAFSELGPGGQVDLANETSPDELPSTISVSFSMDTGIAVTGEATAYVTDRTYEDVTVHVTSSTKPGASVVLHSANPNPVILPDPGRVPGSTLDVKRTGATLSYSVDGGPYTTSQTAIAVGTRVSVGVRGFFDTSPTFVTGIRITRPGTP